MTPLVQGCSSELRSDRLLRDRACGSAAGSAGIWIHVLLIVFGVGGLQLHCCRRLTSWMGGRWAHLHTTRRVLGGASLG